MRKLQMNKRENINNFQINILRRRFNMKRVLLSKRKRVNITLEKLRIMRDKSKSTSLISNKELRLLKKNVLSK